MPSPKQRTSLSPKAAVGTKGSPPLAPAPAAQGSVVSTATLGDKQGSDSIPFPPPPPPSADVLRDPLEDDFENVAASPTSHNSAAGSAGTVRQPRKKRNRTDEVKAQGKKSPTPAAAAGSSEKRKAAEQFGTTTTSPVAATQPAPPDPPQYCDVDEDEVGSPAKRHQPEKVTGSTAAPPTGTEVRPYSISSGTGTMSTPLVPSTCPTVPAPSVSNATTEIVFDPCSPDGDVSIGRSGTDNEEDGNPHSNPLARRARTSWSAAEATNDGNGDDSPPPRIALAMASNPVMPAMEGVPRELLPKESTVEPVALLNPLALQSSSIITTAATVAPRAGPRRQMTLNDFQPPPPIEVTLRKELDDKIAKVDVLSQRIAHLEADLAHRAALHDAALHREDRHEGVIAQYKTSLFVVMQELAQASRRDARREQHARHFELGHVITTAAGGGPAGQGAGAFAGGATAVREMWVEGNRTRELLRQQQTLAKREAYLTQERKDLEKKLAGLRKQGATPSAIADSFLKVASVGGSDTQPFLAGSDENSTAVSGGVSPTFSTASSVKSAANIAEAIDIEERLQTLKRECEAIEEEKRSLQDKAAILDAEKKVFLKEIRRIAEEDASEFAFMTAIGPACSQHDGHHSVPPQHGGSPQGFPFPTSSSSQLVNTGLEGTTDNRRYVLISLLGKGGFSEVWKAYDLKTAQFVACKIHKVGQNMSLQQRQSYLRHAERELEIMRTLNHPKVTKLHDVFEPEGTTDTFVAVMEYCAGTDLDTHLKIHRTVKELDAKTIMIQLIAALRHMADNPKPVIHYDLKPANILFEQQSTLCLDIKVTDFGLSKIIHNAEEEVLKANHAAGIELTSQGTGTYWYLPPECFDTTRTPTITGKVDVWAAGVIFYQMLYGRRPFADGVSQRQIWQEKLISVQATRKWEFPATPSGGAKVSDEAKAVIQRCLAANPSDRCDIFQLSADPYFRKVGKGSAAAASLAAKVATSTANRSGAAYAAADQNNMPPPAARGAMQP